MKQISILLFLFLSLQMSAQMEKDFINTMARSNNLQQVMAENMKRDMAARDARREVLRNANWLTGNKPCYWTNGFMLFGTFYYPEERTISLNLFRGMTPESDPIRALVVNRNGTVTKEEDYRSRYSVERFGNYVMLVERDKQGLPMSAYYEVGEDADNDDTWTLFVQYVLAGCYALLDDTTHRVIFGPRLAHYDGYRYDEDPGMIEGYLPSPDFSSLGILYGFGRVSHGDPSSPKYGKMPGGGGAGALMGPMAWRLRQVAGGMLVEVVRDEPFVSHSPSVKSNSVIRRVGSPYEGIAGAWPFTSVIPLSHQLLRLFPKKVLTLMRGEIYARHGDTFKDPATQRYFDAQPWYKRSSGPIRLTDIETFNYNLIKHVEQSK